MRYCSRRMVNLSLVEVKSTSSAFFSFSFSFHSSSGDDGKVRVWEIATSRCTQELQHPIGNWGQITCLLWITSVPPVVPTEKQFICIGGGRGTIGMAQVIRDSGVRTLFPENLDDPNVTTAPGRRICNHNVCLPHG